MEEPSMPESKPEPGTPMDKFKAAIKDATQEQVDIFKQEIAIATAKNLISAGDIIQIQELINQRQRELDNNVEIKLTPSNVKVGDQLVALNTIFVNDKAVISEGDIVTIKSIEKVAQFASVDTTTTPSVTTTFNFEELNKMFKLKEEVMETNDVDVQSAPLTKQEKDFVDDSFENVNELLKSSVKKDALKKEAGTQSTDDVDSELFEDVTSDC
jgi:hypothetical protein